MRSVALAAIFCFISSVAAGRFMSCCDRATAPGHPVDQRHVVERRLHAAEPSLALHVDLHRPEADALHVDFHRLPWRRSGIRSRCGTEPCRRRSMVSEAISPVIFNARRARCGSGNIRTAIFVSIRLSPCTGRPTTVSFTCAILQLLLGNQIVEELLGDREPASWRCDSAHRRARPVDAGPRRAKPTDPGNRRPAAGRRWAGASARSVRCRGATRRRRPDGPPSATVPAATPSPAATR